MEGFIKEITSTQFFLSLAIVIVCIIVLSLIKQFLIKKVAYTKKSENSKNTLYGVIFNILQYVIIITSLFLILSVHGVNVNTMLAGLGIIATIIGLALQDTIKDIVAGIHIYMDNFYKVGDAVEYNGLTCIVKYFTASTTKLTVLGNEDTITLYNRECLSIRKIKNFQTLFINFPFELDSKKIHNTFEKICKLTDAEYGISNSVFYGPFDFSEKGMSYVLTFRAAVSHLEYRMKVVTIVHDELRKAKLRPTFNEIYNKEAKIWK